MLHWIYHQAQKDLNKIVRGRFNHLPIKLNLQIKKEIEQKKTSAGNPFMPEIICTEFDVRKLEIRISGVGTGGIGVHDFEASQKNILRTWSPSLENSCTK